MLFSKNRTPSDVYRKIYEQHHGPIPKDEFGRTFEIHHIDNNSENNDPSNLVALSIQEHYRVHYEQGDWVACLAMSHRMNLSPEETSRLARNNALKQIENGINAFANFTFEERSKLAKKTNADRVANGSHHWLGPKGNKERVMNGTHNFLGNNNPSHRRMADGTHNFLGLSAKRVQDGTHNFLKATGANNVNYDHTIYHFLNVNTGEELHTTQLDLRTRYNLLQGNLSAVCRGVKKSYKGWVVKNNPRTKKESA
jgi:hypothetical protein